MGQFAKKHRSRIRSIHERWRRILFNLLLSSIMNRPKPPITLQDERNFLLLTIAETEQELVQAVLDRGDYAACERVIEALNQELLIVEVHGLLGYEK